MGYSASTKAFNSLEALIIQLKSASPETESTNSWMVGYKKYFYEIGKEQRDGAITGIVWRYFGERVRKSGGLRIERSGKIIRFPSSTITQRHVAETDGLAEFARIFGV